MRPFSKLPGLLILLVFAVSHAAAFSVVKIDDFEDGKLTWGIWQERKPYTYYVKIVEGEAMEGRFSMLVDMVEGTGVVQRGGLDGALLAYQEVFGMGLWIKAAPGNQVSSVKLIFVEGSGERFSADVPLSAFWQRVTIFFDELNFYPYGGKTVNKIFELDDLVGIRFEGYPGGGRFYLDGIEGLSSLPKLKEVKPKVVINEIKMPGDDEVSAYKYPEKVSNVKINGAEFERDGNPIFLVGGWQSDWDGPPWFLRLLGLEFYNYNADEIYTQYGARKKGTEIFVEWRENPWYPAAIHRTLANGILFWNEFKSHEQWNALKNDFPDIVGMGHFIPYSLQEPLGEKFYHELWKTWMRYTKKYPIFAYELFNEVGYTDDRKPNLKAFREKMKEKYKTIQRANELWGGTKFKSFDEVVPPHLLPGSKLTSSYEGDQIFPNLQVDWAKFLEEQFANGAKKLMPMMKAYDPRDSVFTTIQTHAHLPYIYGVHGVHPESIPPVSDFYSHEVGLKFYPQDNGKLRTEQLKDMLRYVLPNDVVRGIAANMPIINSESPVSVSSETAPQDEMVSDSVIQLHGQMKFYDATVSIPNNWERLEYDDSSWNLIKVPSMWGREGYPNTTTGLYRKEFIVPEEMRDRELYFNGGMFADKALIYFNGNLIHETEKYDEVFSLKLENIKYGVKNVIAVKITNTYFENGMYYGGIRGFASINDYPAKRAVTLQPSHFRAHLWTQVVHGMNGVAVCYAGNLYTQSAKTLPKVKMEINSVLELLKRPRIKGQIAMVYPFETFRGAPCPSYQDFLQGKCVLDIVDFYGPLLLSGVPLDVIQNKDLEKLKNYKMIVFPSNLRVEAANLRPLLEYVEAGGIIVADMLSFSINDYDHTPLDFSALLGVTVNGWGKETNRLSSKVFSFEKALTRTRWLDGIQYVNITPKGAEVLATFDDGSPAITVHKIGKGKVYYLGAELDYQHTEKILWQIMAENEISPEIAVLDQDGKRLSTIESHRFGDEGRYLIYLMNWGYEQPGIVKWQQAGGSGYYRIRNTRTGLIMRSPSGQLSWTSAELEKGIATIIPSQDPLVWIVEREELEPLPLHGISPVRYEMLTRLWNERKFTNGNGKTIGLTPTTGYPIVLNSDIPTAEAFANMRGFRTTLYNNEKEALENLDILIWLDPGYAVKDKDVVLQWVANGGGLCLLSQGILSYHEDIKGIQGLMESFGIKQEFMQFLMATDPQPGGDQLMIEVKDIEPHALTEGIRSFVTTNAGILTVQRSDADVLIKAPRNTNYPGTPLMVAFPYGKGRVVIMSDARWLQPLNIDQGDNLQLWGNVLSYLAQEPIKLVAKEEREAALYITEELLKKAEKQEEQGVTTLEPIQIEADEGKIEYPKSGYNDPIIDFMR